MPTRIQTRAILGDKTLIACQIVCIEPELYSAIINQIGIIMSDLDIATGAIKIYSRIRITIDST